MHVLGIIRTAISRRLSYFQLIFCWKITMRYVRIHPQQFGYISRCHLLKKTETTTNSQKHAKYEYLQNFYNLQNLRIPISSLWDNT